MKLVRPICSAAVSLVCLLVVSSITIGDEIPTDPKIETPFDSDKMPSGISVLRDCMRKLDQADGWTADVILSTGDDGLRFSGRLARAANAVAGVMNESDSDRKLQLLLNEKQAIGWIEQQATGGELESLTRLARTVTLLSLITQLPGEDASADDFDGSFDIRNLGVANIDGVTHYAIELTAKADSAAPGHLAGSDIRRAVVLVSVAEILPKSITVETESETRQRVELGSLATGSAGGGESVGSPSADAAVVELLAAQDESGEPSLKNPVPYTAESIARGEQLYRADCVVCHSADGTGRDSDVTDNAADLTNSEYWLSDGSEGATFLAIRDGAGDEMPGYIDEYRDEKLIWDLVNYIRKLQGK